MQTSTTYTKSSPLKADIIYAQKVLLSANEYERNVFTLPRYKCSKMYMKLYNTYNAFVENHVFNAHTALREYHHFILAIAHALKMKLLVYSTYYKIHTQLLCENYPNKEKMNQIVNEIIVNSNFLNSMIHIINGTGYEHYTHMFGCFSIIKSDVLAFLKCINFMITRLHCSSRLYHDLRLLSEKCIATYINLLM